MFGPAVAEVGEALGAIAAEDRSGWSAAARSERLLELVGVLEQARAAVIACVGEWDADLAWAADGSKSPAAWLARRAPVTTPEARDLVRAGRLVQSHGATAKALATGDVTSAHVTTAARAARHVEDLYAQHEDVLLDAARALSPDDFRLAAARWRAIADDVAGRKPRDRFERRHLHLSEVLDGMGRIDGYLDGETVQRLAQLLDRLEPPDPDGGDATPRTLGQRRADAMSKLVIGDRRRAATVVHAVVDVDSLAGLMPSDLSRVRADLMGAGGGPVDLATLLRMTCDCSIARVLVRGKSVVLDLGRSTPMVSEAQRRALAIRDGGCTEPGCSAPPDWCDAHHEWHWADGGPTDLSNLELKCRRHHVAAHRHRRRGPPLDLAA